MHVEPRHTPEQLADLIRAESRAPIALRLMAVRLAGLGRTAAQVAEQVLLCERQVRTWVARYDAGGVEALSDRPGRGRKPTLSADEGARLKARLLAGPTQADGVCTLRGEDVRLILRRESGVVRCLQAVYDLMHRLGLEPLRPRPRHPDADPEAQAAFKKASPGSSPRSPRPAPASGSRSGSRTRPGSARRGRPRRSGPVGAAARWRRSRPPTATCTC